MKIPGNALALVVFLFSAAFTTYSQPSNDPCGCNAALVGGIFSERVQKGETAAEQFVISEVTSSSFDTFTNAVAQSNGQTISAGGGGVGWKVYGSYGFTQNMNREAFEAKKKELSQKYSSNSRSASSQELLEKYGDPIVANAWTKCKELCSSEKGREGIHSWFEIKGDTGIFLLIKFNGVGELVISDSSVEGGRSNLASVAYNKLFKPGETLPHGVTRIAITRNSPSDAVIVNIRMRGADILEYIPRVISPLVVSKSNKFETIEWLPSDNNFNCRDGELEGTDCVIKAGKHKSKDAMLYGGVRDFIDFGAGWFMAFWDMSLDRPPADNSMVAVLRVWDRDVSKELARKDLSSRDWDEVGQKSKRFYVPFEVQRINIGHSLDFQVLWVEKGDLRCHRVGLKKSQ